MRRSGLLALLAVPLLAGACSHTAAHQSAPTFGGYPSFLPRSTVDTNAQHDVVDASVTSPALATQGDPVRVHLAHGTTTVTVTGPEVPNEGLAFQSPLSPATWLVSLTQVTGAVPLSSKAFNAIDEDGRVYRLSVVGTPLPAQVTTGKSVTFALTTSIATGEGRLRWIPSGHLAPVEWDFTVETD